MTVNVGINGFGRIGRTFLRALLARPELGIEVVGINDIQPLDQLAYLLEFDSVAGRLSPVDIDGDTLQVGGRTIPMLCHSSPEDLPWGDLGVDVVVESSRLFVAAAQARRHLTAGAPVVIVSAPSEGADATVVVGVNDNIVDPGRHRVISNASCTTNCLAPLAKVLDDAFGIEDGLMTTVHSYTSDQALVDGAGGGLRDARAAALNIIPSSTGAARAIRLVLPHLDGRLDGAALRVPVPDGSIADLTVSLGQKVTPAAVNDAVDRAARDTMRGIVEYSESPLVSTDIVGNRASCVFDAPLTTVAGRLVKVFGWYDNEWGYSNRLAELTAIAGRKPRI